MPKIITTFFQLPVQADYHIPRGSGDGNWQIVDANNNVLATIDPNMHLEDDTVADVAQFLVDALNTATVQGVAQVRGPQDEAAEYGCYIGHDPNGWYVADESERERDETGLSVGFDGRPHWPTEQDAAHALVTAENPADVMKAD